jgi:hypothetical protein
MAPISCLTWRQKSGSNHLGGSPITRVDFGCGEQDGPNHPVHSVNFYRRLAQSIQQWVGIITRSLLLYNTITIHVLVSAHRCDWPQLLKQRLVWFPFLFTSQPMWWGSSSIPSTCSQGYQYTQESCVYCFYWESLLLDHWNPAFEGSFFCTSQWLCCRRLSGIYKRLICLFNSTRPLHPSNIRMSALETTMLPKRLQQCSLIIPLFNTSIFIS